MEHNSKYIFTFWEPLENIPGYLQLCIETWSKFLPDYRIFILNYSNLAYYLGNDYFDKYLYKKFPLALQSDAIRCAILKKYGGIWLDADTIITSSNAFKFIGSNKDFSLVGESIGVIVASQNSKILNSWDKNIKRKIALHKKSKNIFNYFFHYRYWRKFKRWDYLGNSILKKILPYYPDKFCSINILENKIMPERNYFCMLKKVL